MSEPNEPMSEPMIEPTKEQIEEASKLRGEFSAYSSRLYVVDLAKLIAHLRTEATNEALEQAAGEFDRLERQRPRSVIHCESVAVKLRAMKVKA